MKERFTFFAQVLLTRRLRSLLRVDEVIEVDMSYITCAEYQLFINAQRVKKRQVQPDHWTTDRFTPGTAKHPITGVRANDAEAFCDWLTQQDFTPGFRYRLPKSSEVENHSTNEKEIGCWCQDSSIYTIAGISEQQWNKWQQQLQEQLKLNILSYIEAGSFLPEFSYNQARARVCAFANNQELKLAIGLVIALVLARILDRVSLRVRLLTSAGYLDTDRDHKDVAFDIDIALNIATVLYGVLTNAINRDVSANAAIYTTDRDFKILTSPIEIVRDLSCLIKTDMNIAIGQDLNSLLNRTINIARTIARRLKIDVDINIARTIARERERDINHLLDRDLNHVLDGARTIISNHDRTQSLAIFQNYLLSIYSCLDLLVAFYRDGTKNQQYINFQHEAGQLYCYFALIELRRRGKVPTWEGIRIVRERIEF